jgi:hypothetical protein
MVARRVGASFTPGYFAGHALKSLAVLSQMRLREFFSPTCNGLGLGVAHSSLEKSLDLSIT